MAILQAKANEIRSPELCMPSLIKLLQSAQSNKNGIIIKAPELKLLQ